MGKLYRGIDRGIDLCDLEDRDLAEDERESDRWSQDRDKEGTLIDLEARRRAFAKGKAGLEFSFYERDTYERGGNMARPESLSAQ